MGLFDKLIQKYAADEPDYMTILQQKLGANDSVLAFSKVIPSAYTRSGGRRIDSAIMNAVANVASTSQHVGGGADSIASQLKRGGEMNIIVLSAQNVTWWSFEMSDPANLELDQRIAAEKVASIAPTGKRSQGGSQVFRIVFTDDSFFDYNCLVGNDGFWDCASRFGTQPAQ